MDLKNRRLHLLLVVLILLSILPIQGFKANDDGERVEPPTRDGYPQQDGGSDSRLFQYRSMWLEGYQIVNISEVKAVVKYARDFNFNCLSPLINGNHYGVFYNSTILPKHTDVHWSFDPLMELIKEAHKYGIHVHPWFHTFLDPIAGRGNPSWRMVSYSGNPTSSWINPAHPEVRSYLVNITRELVTNYPLDGIKLDTVRYPNYYYSFDDYTVQKFYDQGGGDFDQFRRDQITECIELIYDNIMDIRPYIWVGADVFTGYSGAYSYVLQDYRAWSNLGIIDYVTPMTYTTSVSYYSDLVLDHVTYDGVPVVMGTYVYIPGNTAHGSVENESVGISKMVQQTEAAISNGALGTCMFSYKFLRQYRSYGRALRDGPFSREALCPLKEQKFPVDNSRWDFDMDHDREGWRTTGMGHYYPAGDVWSISGSRTPGLMSPRLNITAEGTNVIEISLRSDSDKGRIDVYWSRRKTEFPEDQRISVPIKEDRDWNLYSIHLDNSTEWWGPIRYLRIVFRFEEPSNITLDLISLHWMPDCIDDWAYLGPFLTGETEQLLEREFIDNEGSMLPVVGDISSGRMWKRFHMERDLVDLRFALGRLTYSTAYAHVYVISPEERNVEIRVGTSDGFRSWLNGDEQMGNTIPRRVSPDLNITTATLNEGINSIMLKIAVYENEFSFYFRITGPGNTTMDDLEFIHDIPPPSSPCIFADFEDWTHSKNCSVNWTTPPSTVPIIGYEWSLDNGDEQFLETNRLYLTSLNEGLHTISVWAVDQLGLKSEISTLSFGVDTDTPEIGLNEFNSHFSKSGKLNWTWELEHDPLSGISGYWVNIKKIGIEGGTEIRTIFTTKRYLRIDDAEDGCYYTAEVKAVSNNGLYSIEEFDNYVLVDLSPPKAPKTITIDHFSTGTNEYTISWSAARDNVEDGISHYELWRKISGNEWVHLTDVNRTMIRVERPIGTKVEYKARAMDLSGQVSEFTEKVIPGNLPPVPNIDREDTFSEGRPLSITSNGSYDPDGRIISYHWYLDGTLISNDNEISLTLEEGSTWIILEVTDDLGSSFNTSLKLTLTKGILGSLPFLSDELEEMSWTDIHLEPEEIKHYNNRTVFVVPENLSQDREGMQRNDVLTVSSMVLFIILFLVVSLSTVSMVVLILRSHMERKVNTKKRILKKEEYEVTFKSNQKHLLEALRTRRALPGPGIKMGSPKGPHSGSTTKVDRVQYQAPVLNSYHMSSVKDIKRPTPEKDKENFPGYVENEVEEFEEWEDADWDGDIEEFEEIWEVDD